MSKKILKRSLTLGALMAFVIIGNAWAAELVIDGSNYSKYESTNGLNGSDETGLYNDNIVTVSYDGDYTKWQAVAASFTGSGDVADNALKINNGTFHVGEIFSGGSAKGNAINNKTVINGGTFGGNSIYMYGGIAAAGSGKYDAMNNVLEINNCVFNVSQKLVGGMVAGDNSKPSDENGTAENNVVVINGGTFNARSEIAGGWGNANVIANNNSVIISGGNFNADTDIYGGRGRTYAENNEVVIRNARFSSGVNVYGAYIKDSTDCVTKNNTITIGKDAKFEGTVNLYGSNQIGSANNSGNTLNIIDAWFGTITSIHNFDILNIKDNAVASFSVKDENLKIKIENSTWDANGESLVNTLAMSNGVVKHYKNDNITVRNYSGEGKIEFTEGSGYLYVDSGNGSFILTESDKTADDINTVEQLTNIAKKLGVEETATKDISAKVVIAEGKVKGEATGVVSYNAEAGTDGYHHGYVAEEDVTEKVNTKSDAVSDAGVVLKGHWRAHMNDMNKRMGELRNANGEHGVWTRMVRGESEYQGAKMQYNQYQMGYDEKLSVDKRWTVGAAVTFSEGDASYGSGSTDDKSTAFAIYGSKLNNDGTFVDLIARYARLESDLDDGNYGIGNYDANGYSVSAEFGKRIQQGNGLWIEPQAELTYGSVDGAQVNFSKGFTADYGSMDSFIARVGFAMGKDIKQGNVYARASYLYDFDGETETQFVGGNPISEDFGGGWWEVGVGANINLSKATYIYADVEKTFGGEVDTNWQWNLGVRYSF